jgi:ribosomal protein S18 acetylase RimI-like enzyme
MCADVILRPIRKDDAAELQAAALESWKYTYRDIFDSQFIEDFVHRHYAPEATLALFPQIETGSMFFHVAEHRSQIIGFCNIGSAGPIAELYRIYLTPAYIGQGIGRGLLEHGEGFLIEKGTNAYFCHVHGRNELGKRFYLRSGFTHVPEKDRGDEWYMEKRLSMN